MQLNSGLSPRQPMNTLIRTDVGDKIHQKPQWFMPFKFPDEISENINNTFRFDFECGWVKVLPVHQASWLEVYWLFSSFEFCWKTYTFKQVSLTWSPCNDLWLCSIGTCARNGNERWTVNQVFAPALPVEHLSFHFQNYKISIIFRNPT